jgi:hypothetical protein
MRVIFSVVGGCYFHCVNDLRIANSVQLGKHE